MAKSPHPIPAQCNPVEVVTLSPGVYCNGIILDACANVVYLPGEYIIKDKQLAMLSNSVANGDGVGFYLTGSNPPSSTATVFFDSNTRLEFCHFRATTSTHLGMTEFPDMGMQYGVFAPSDFSKAISKGWHRSDDEDKKNNNSLGADVQSDLPRIKRIVVPVDNGRNTVLRTARVR